MIRRAKPFGVRVGELVDRLEALSYRHGRPQFAISYCIVPAESLSEHSFFAWTEPRRSAPVPGRSNVRTPAARQVAKIVAPPHLSAPEDGRTPRVLFQTGSEWRG